MHIRVFLTAATMAVGLLAPSMAAAADKPTKYFGINGGGTFELDPAEVSGDGNVLGLELGYELNNFLAVEVQAGVLLGMADVAGDNPDGNYAAAFARFNLPFEDLNVYALAGAARVAPDDLDADDALTGPAFGIGIDLYGSAVTALSLEAVRMEDADGRTFQMLTVGWKRHFEWPSFR